jgi:hypothetical protein
MYNDLSISQEKKEGSTIGDDKMRHATTACILFNSHNQKRFLYMQPEHAV